MEKSPETLKPLDKLIGSLIAKMHIDPIRDSRYQLDKGLSPAVWDELSSMHEQSVAGQIVEHIVNADIKTVLDIERQFSYEVHMVPIVGGVFLNIFTNIFYVIGLRKAELTHPVRFSEDDLIERIRNEVRAGR